MRGLIWLTVRKPVMDSLPPSKVCSPFVGKDLVLNVLKGFPGGSDGEESPCNAGDLGLIPGLERFPGEGHGYLLHSSILVWEVPRTAVPGGLQSLGSQSQTLLRD